MDARDVSQYKVDLIEENIHRANSINVQARVKDATVFDVDLSVRQILFWPMFHAPAMA